MLNQLLRCLFLSGSIVMLFPALKSYGNGERPVIRFGEPRPEDFAIGAVPFDSGATAVIIADIGRTEYKNTSQDELVMMYTRTIRVKIIAKDGVGAGTRELWLRRQRPQGMEMEVLEKLEKIKGIVFNQENGHIVSTPLDPTQIFTEEQTYGQRKKFTLPALKEGSLFDLTYSISSYWGQVIPAWHFQTGFPCLWSEYTITVPPAFNFVMQRVGDDNYAFTKKEDIYQRFSIQKEHGIHQAAAIDLDGVSVRQTWARKDVPGIHTEEFISSTDNFSPAIYFQFNYYKWMGGSARGANKASWTRVIGDLEDESYFGMVVNSTNNFDAELKAMGPLDTDPVLRAKRIYQWVRDNFRCTDYHELYTDRTLKQIISGRSGSEVELNFLLIALLRQAGIAADPALLSTREHGVADQSYPQLTQFNYVLCAAKINGRRVPLDASRRGLGFGKLVPECFNGPARIICKTDSSLILLYTDSLRENQTTNMFISNDAKDFLVGNFEQTLGETGALETRERKNQHSFEERMKAISAGFNGPVHIENSGMDAADETESPITLHFDFDLKEQAGQDMLYFNPVVARYETNPFHATTRQFPVELPYCLDENYNLTMEIPKGYTVDELPKSTKVSLNETDGFFEYLVQASATRIQMRIHLKFYKTIFPVADYHTLRDFYAFIVKKEAEQIVFKKSR